MAYKDPARMAEYMLNRYHKRREDALSALGARCSECSRENNLQIDHIDPKKKSFSIAKMWGVSEKRFWEEINKCQLLCEECHERKTLRDLGRGSAKNTHGTLSSYRYCGPPKCEKCKRAKRDQARRLRQTKNMGR